MILLAAVLAGILVGWACARLKGKAWQPPTFKTTWLVVLGFLPQLVVFYLPITRQYVPDNLASFSLILSQITLIIFALINRTYPGMLVLVIGLGLNFSVILANGGFMPLPFETAERFVPSAVLKTLQIGARISNASKDVLLPEAQINFRWLADRFVYPWLVPYRFAFSIGDVLIALGAFWLLAQVKPIKA